MAYHIARNNLNYFYFHAEMLALSRKSGHYYVMAISWHIGDVIKKLREIAGIKQGELALSAGIRPATMSRVEITGKHDPETLKKIAAALNTTVAEIHSLVPGPLPQKLAETSSSPCPEGIPEHTRYHVKLEHVLHGNDLKCINAVVAVLEAASGDYPGNTGSLRAVREVELARAAEKQVPYGSSRTERQHGPFDPNELPVPGVSNIEFKDPVLKKKRK